jgi:sulfur carrier protein ThiS
VQSVEKRIINQASGAKTPIQSRGVLQVIRVYPSQLHGQPLETHEIKSGQAITDWLSENVSEYSEQENPPILIRVDGNFVPAEKWGEFKIATGSEVDIFPAPRGGGDNVLAALNPTTYFTTVGSFNASQQFFTYLLGIEPPDTPEGRAAGQSLSAGDVEANTARPNQPVRKVFGEYKVFPDILSPPVSRFVDKRKIVTKHQLHITEGGCTVAQSEIKIGDTPIANFGLDADVDIYQPGSDLSSDDRFDIWYPSPEVSPSTGGSGLDLGSTAPSGSAVIADSLTIGGIAGLGVININGADAEYPTSWTQGTMVQVKVPDDVVVTSFGGYNVFNGNFQDLAPFVGMKVTVSTPADDYALVVQSYTDNSGTNDVLQFNDDNGTAFDLLPAATYRIAMGYRGHNYELAFDPSGIGTLVKRLKDDGTADNAWNGWLTRSDIVDYEYSSQEAGAANWLGPFIATPDGRKTNKIEYDISFPQGLVIYNDDGDETSLTRTVEIQWRDADIGGAWTTVTRSFTERTPDAIGFTYSLDLPYSMRPQIQMRRVEAAGKKQAVDRILWYGLRAKMPERVNSYPNDTVMGVTIRSGDRLGSQTDRKISVVADSGTDKISDAFFYITDSLGIPRSQIDETKVNQLETEVWTPRGEDFRFSVSGQQTCRDVLNTVLAAGFSTLIPQDGLISVEREGVKPTSGIITPEEQVSTLKTSFKAQSADDFDAVDVEYVSRDTWKKETVECRLPGITPTKIEKISVSGMSREKAWRKGMRTLRKNIYQRESYSTETELDARNYDYMSRITLIDDIPQTTQTSMVTRYTESGGTVTITTTENAQDGGYNRVIIRRHDGTATGLLTPVSIGYYNVTLNASDIDFDMVTDGSIEPPRIVYCSTTEQGYSATITSVSPSDDGKTRVQAVEYNAVFYEDDDNSPE